MMCRWVPLVLAAAAVAVPFNPAMSGWEQVAFTDVVKS